MWVTAGVLVGAVILISLIGFHSGPHAHVLAGVVGVAGAAWLVLMAVEGRSMPALWALLSADLVVSAGVIALAWRGLAARGTVAHQLGSVEGAEGVAVSDLTPEGIVRVRGNSGPVSWSTGPCEREPPYRSSEQPACAWKCGAKMQRPCRGTGCSSSMKSRGTRARS